MNEKEKLFRKGIMTGNANRTNIEITERLKTNTNK